MSGNTISSSLSKPFYFIFVGFSTALFANKFSMNCVKHIRSGWYTNVKIHLVQADKEFARSFTLVNVQLLQKN